MSHWGHKAFHMNGIHPSLYRLQFKELAKQISKALQYNHTELANHYRAELQHFRENNVPWVPDAYFANDLTSSNNPSLLVLEEVGDNYLIYPSKNPGKILLFQSKEEAVHYATRHYTRKEITVPQPDLLSLTEMHAIANLFSK